MVAYLPRFILLWPLFLQHPSLHLTLNSLHLIRRRGQSHSWDQGLMLCSVGKPRGAHLV